MVDTTDEWIRTRTGICERRILENGATSDLGAGALRALLKNRGIAAADLDLIIVATVTPDMFFPSTACLIQDKVGAKNAWGFDLSAACSGFLFALVTGAQFIESGTCPKGRGRGRRQDEFHHRLHRQEHLHPVRRRGRGGAPGAGGRRDTAASSTNRSAATGPAEPPSTCAAAAASTPRPTRPSTRRCTTLYQDGKAVFKVAVVGMADVSAEIMERNHLTGADIDWLVPHQANLRIIDATASGWGSTVRR